MKKCKWCNSNIEDDATTCPYCKANQNSSGTQANKNRVETYLEKQSNAKPHRNSTTNYKQKSNTYVQNDQSDDIHQIATDLRFIKNVIIVILSLYVIGAIYIALYIL